MTETPTSRGRELGGDLRDFRKRDKLTVRMLQRRFDWPHGKVSRIESGERPPDRLDATRILDACRTVSQADYRRLVAMADEPGSDYWVRPGGKAPEQLCSLIKAESRASWMVCFDPKVVHGLLQTETYARAIYRLRAMIPVKEQDEQIRIRMTRQELFSRPSPPRCVFFLTEHALRRELGGPQVTYEQLLYLLLATSPKCSVRIVPESAGPIDAVIDPFTIFGDTSDDTALYMDGVSAGVFIDAPDVLREYDGLARRLDSLALNGGQSRAWLADLASEYDRMEDCSDDRAHRAREELA